MRIIQVRLNTAGSRAIAMAASPAGSDEELWSVPNAFRDTCCVPRGILAAEDLELTALLESMPPPAERIRVEATAASATGVFVQGGYAFIEPSDWHGGRAECRIHVDAAALRALGVCRHRGVWNWQFQPEGGAGSPLGASEHLVFVIADSPTFPWSGAFNPSPTEATPWPGPLALACEWGSGATTPAEAASRVLTAVTNLRSAAGDGWHYDSGGSAYLTAGLGRPHWFFCASFIKAVREIDTTLAHRLSCYEAAAVMVTFANLLGCRLQPVLLRTEDCDDLHVNAVWPLGQTVQTGVAFGVHVVACDTSPATRDAFLAYDPVLRVDTDESPNQPAHIWQFPNAVPLGLTTSPAGTGRYLPQLILDGDLGSARDFSLDPAQVAIPDDQSHFDPCDLVRWGKYVAELSGLDRVPPAGPTTFKIARFTDSPGTPLPAGRGFLPPVPPRHRTVYYPTNPDDQQMRGMILMADFWTGDAVATRSFMAELLATAERRPVRQNHPGIVYAAPDNETLWILLDGAAARLTSVGSTPVDLMQILMSATPA